MTTIFPNTLLKKDLLLSSKEHKGGTKNIPHVSFYFIHNHNNNLLAIKHLHQSVYVYEQIDINLHSFILWKNTLKHTSVK